MVRPVDTNTGANSDLAKDRNEDPITGEPGAHPVGTGWVRLLVALQLGRWPCAVGGPVGAAVGAVVGGIAGGLGGKAIAEGIDPTLETDYWRSNYSSRPYAQTGMKYDEFEPAYRTGWESYDANSKFEDRENDLQRKWEATKGKSKLTWTKRS